MVVCSSTLPIFFQLKDAIRACNRPFRYDVFYAREVASAHKARWESAWRT